MHFICNILKFILVIFITCFHFIIVESNGENIFILIP